VIPGLRGRLVLALLGTSALTIGVVALALLSPLERRLRDHELEGLRESARSVRPVLSRVSRTELRPESRAFDRAVREAAEVVDGQVVIVAGDGSVLDSSVNRPGFRAAQAYAAVRDRRAITTVTTGGSGAIATYASTARVAGEHVGFSVSRPLDEVASAASVVRHAVVVAALVGLGAALILGLALAAGLVRRLRLLHDTVLRVARLGAVVEMTPDPTRDEIGDLSRAFASMQNRLHRQEEARRTFVSTASHELRTPLSSLVLMLELAREELARAGPDVQDARDEVERAGYQAERLAALADQLLDLSRIDAGVSLEMQAIDLEPLASAVVREFAGRAAGRDQPLRLDAAPGTWALADSGAVVQIMRIALDNALRYNPRGAPLEVQVTADVNARVVRVRDHGPGIRPEERELLFERFRRGAHITGDGGFGLGLPIGRELASQMNGQLVLRDAHPGVCVELRLMPTPPPAPV
jgi:signal transduction histidine kinase